MNYIHELIKLAKELESECILDYNFTSFKFKVSLRQVMYREKNTYLRLSIEGYGFTIEDAAYDFLRKCRGDKLVHLISNKEIGVI